MAITYGFCKVKNRDHVWEDFDLHRGSTFKNPYYYCRHCKIKESEVRSRG